MTNSTKVTKKDMFIEVIALAKEAGRADIEEFAAREIELLDKRYAAKTGKISKAKQEERDGLKEVFLQALEDGEAKRVKDLAEAAGVTPQKASPILKALAEEGRLVKTTEKRITMYQLA